jgi:hypothetical protein
MQAAHSFAVKKEDPQNESLTVISAVSIDVSADRTATLRPEWTIVEVSTSRIANVGTAMFWGYPLPPRHLIPRYS